ncbi:ATP-binding cassette domain-containing protein [Vannielia litorea]|nr:ATP-binding cassette domain-containing protein [Vannielia litorea]
MSDGVSTTASRPIIRLRGIARSFTRTGGEGQTVLRGIDLEIEQGSFTVIRGESGSGKTTLLRILGMLDSSFEGSYEMGGQRVDGQPDWVLDELRADNIGFVFQDGRLFEHMTLRRNVEVPLTLHGLRDRAALDERVQTLQPRFYGIQEDPDTLLERRPAQVSGGQSQRASIMRAMINRPAIILADEPTASLHPSLKAGVVEHLKELCELGHTVIVVSHDDVFYGVGRQLQLDSGVLEERDPGPAANPGELKVRAPAAGECISWGWRPRTPLWGLAMRAMRETLDRRLFLALIVLSLAVGVCQLSVFSSVIVGAQDYVNAKVTEGSRLNRIQIKPRAKDRAEEERFPPRAEIASMEAVAGVVPRRATTTRVITSDGEKKTFSVSGLHSGDPEYNLLNFLAGSPFSESHGAAEVILTSGLLGDVFGTGDLEDGITGYDNYIGRRVTVVINRYNKSGELVQETPVELSVQGIILNGEGGRQLYFPNQTLLMFDRLVRDRSGTLSLPENAGPEAWPTAVEVAELADFPWEDSLHVYAREIRGVLPLFTDLSKLGYKPESDIWDFKWALDIQDTAWTIFLPLLALIVVALAVTVWFNIVLSARLRVRELALWRVLGMRRGDLVLTEVVSIIFSVGIGAIAGVLTGAMLIRLGKEALRVRSAEAAAASGEAVQEFDAIFAPVGDFAWFMIAGAILLGVLSAIWPAIQTAKTDPAKVLSS